MRALLLLPLAMTLAACSEDEPVASEGPFVVEVAQQVNAESGEFSTLIAAVTAAELAAELSGDGQRTVFAPTGAYGNDAKIVQVDVQAENGVIRVITRC